MTRTIVATYPYGDENDKVIYEAVRYDPKDFSQRVPLGNGLYLYKLDGVRRVPYRLTDLLKRKARETVFVVEGEKDADALHALGFCATTSAQGAGWEWTPEFVEYFHGSKRVAVIPDCDEGDPIKGTRKGREAAASRSRLLRDLCDDVRVIDLAPERSDGYDVSDWIAEGHTGGELKAQVESAPRLTAPSNAVASHPVEWDDVRPWPTLGADAYHGLAGEIVAAVEPETEADPAAMLFTVLTVAGNMAGKNTRARVHDDEHPPRLFTTIVGGSNSGAKGTGLAALRQMLRASNEEWFDNRLLGGFGSGEAIIAELLAKDGQPFDPRLLILETEFARLLAVNNRESSTSSMTIRQAWDGHKLENRRSKDKVVATNHHVSCLAHITPEELLARLTETDSTNGFANRFLFVASKRSKKLPFGGNADREREAVNRFAKRLRVATASAQKSRTITFSETARKVWDPIYRAEPERGGLVGALTARANAQKLRIAVTYAILDEAGAIEPEHVLAAEACWRYSVATVEHIFGALRGDSVQDRLLDKLRTVYPQGLNGVAQDALNTKNLPAGRLQGARQALEHDGLIRTETQAPGEKGGRPSIISFANPKQTEQPGLTYEGRLLGVNPVNPFVSISTEERPTERLEPFEVVLDASIRETDQPGLTALSDDAETLACERCNSHEVRLSRMPGIAYCDGSCGGALVRVVRAPVVDGDEARL